MKEETTRTTSWKVVLAVLIGLPILLSSLLNLWLGVPSETTDSEPLFRKLRLEPVVVVKLDSLQFGKMFFCRFRVADAALVPLVEQLNDYEFREGPPQKPISFKLERPWWEPDLQANGQTWNKYPVTLWSDARDPQLFYAVIEGGGGDEVEVSKTRE